MFFQAELAQQFPAKRDQPVDLSARRAPCRSNCRHVRGPEGRCGCGRRGNGPGAAVLRRAFAWFAGAEAAVRMAVHSRSILTGASSIGVPCRPARSLITSVALKTIPTAFS